MALPTGTRLGPYEIHSAIGAGGMGEVYRARDPRLGRDVAIKVLPSAFSADPERLHRFEQEARAAAALNHPNILAVYDIGQHEGSPYIVSELLEGETLRERLQAGALPVRKAVEVAVQVCHGLAAAHEKGITHRDLKPENLFLTTDGRLKILDFGLAKLTQSEAVLAGASALPTTPAIGQAHTVPGMVLGTIGYMAPEQVRGLQADQRSDIFAFGTILYEMLSGQRAFHGDTAMDTMTAILKEDPPELPAAERQIPPALLRIVARCLEKNPAARFKSADDLAFALEGMTSHSDVAGPVATIQVRASRERIAWMAVAVLLMGLLATSVPALRHVSEPLPADVNEMRLEISTPVGSGAFALSPDGRKLVFADASQLWLRPLEQEAAQPLAGTEGTGAGQHPFWSPDSRSIGFFAGGQLKRMDLDSGLVQVLASAPIGNGAAWSREGTILFARSSTGGLYRISAGGGEVAAATQVELPAQGGHRFPQFLPDGRHFVFFALGTPERRGVHLGQLDSAETRRLFDADSAAMFVPPDFLFFARQGGLVAQRLNLDTLEPTGDRLPVAARVDHETAYFSVALSAALTGPVAYRADDKVRRLVWLDRSGREVGAVGEPDAAQPLHLRLSGDDSRVALRRSIGGNSDVWLMETARGILQRLTVDTAFDDEPVWSPDGKRVAFASLRNGLPDLYVKTVSDAERETPLLTSSEFKNLYDWSPDGRFLLYSSQTPEAGRDLWALPLSGDAKPVSVAQTAFEERTGRFAPDSRWIAYQSNETGQYEVYVQPFPGPGGKVRVSSGGGTAPTWRRDGRELFYLAGGVLTATPLKLGAATVELGTSAPLFMMPPHESWDVSADGQRFLINRVSEEPPSITVLLNWAGRRR